MRVEFSAVKVNKHFSSDFELFLVSPGYFRIYWSHIFFFKSQGLKHQAKTNIWTYFNTVTKIFIKINQKYVKKPKVHVNVVKSTSETPVAWILFGQSFLHMSLHPVKKTCRASVITAGAARWPERTDSPRWQIHCFIMMHYKEKHVWSSINPACVRASFRETPIQKCISLPI